MDKIITDIDKLLNRRIESMGEGNPFHEFCKEYIVSFQNKVNEFKEDLDSFIPNVLEELEITILNLSYFYSMEEDLTREKQFKFTLRVFNQIEHKIFDIIV